MRRRRFVRLLGSAVEDAGREVGALAAERRARDGHAALTAESESPGGSGSVARELPRRVAQCVDGAGAGGVAFSARVASPASPTGDDRTLGVVLCVDLPEYAVAAGVVAAVRPLAVLSAASGGDLAGLADAAERLLDVTSDAFVFAFPVGGTVRVVPAAAVAGAAAAGELDADAFPDALYSRSVGRFVEEFAEGFVGDRALAAPVDGLDDRRGVREFQRATGVRDVLVVEVSAVDGRTDATLADFAGE